MKKILLTLCIIEIYFFLDLAFSEHLQNTIICVVIEDGATSAFCKLFFEENSFVLSEMMIYRSIFLPALLIIAAIGSSVYYYIQDRFYIREEYEQAVKINFLLGFVAFILFSLIVLGY